MEILLFVSMICFTVVHLSGLFMIINSFLKNQCDITEEIK
jgi:hypothetical protein